PAALSCRRDRGEGPGQRAAVHVDAGGVHGPGPSRLVHAVRLLLAVEPARVRRVRRGPPAQPARREVRGSDPRPDDHRGHALDRDSEAPALAGGDAALDPGPVGERWVRQPPGRDDVHPAAGPGGAAGPARDRQGAGAVEPVRGERAGEPGACGDRARGGAVSASGDRVRNVVLVVFDTLRLAAVGCDGAPPPWGAIATPVLDAFARESVRFTRAYPESLPTLCARRALYTGQRTYPFRDGDFRLKGDFPGVAPGWGPIPEAQHT